MAFSTRMSLLKFWIKTVICYLKTKIFLSVPWELNNQLSGIYGLNLFRKGIYPGYHMNHKHWISVVLNETLSDNEVMKLIENSFSLT
ncbi:MmcQ/YjbR family DNA-binding protein [Peptoanaerobacter stomatis]